MLPLSIALADRKRSQYSSLTPPQSATRNLQSFIMARNESADTPEST
jgi:hypothetical protein